MDGPVSLSHLVILKGHFIDMQRHTRNIPLNLYPPGCGIISRTRNFIWGPKNIKTKSLRKNYLKNEHNTLRYRMRRTAKKSI
jgi:hypothetical protein